MGKSATRRSGPCRRQDLQHPDDRGNNSPSRHGDTCDEAAGDRSRVLLGLLGATVVSATALVLRWLLSEDVQTISWTTPHVWLVHDFLSGAEVDTLIAMTANLPSRCWDTVSETQQTVMLEDCPLAADHVVMRAVDERVASALNMSLSQVELGYMQVYHASYSAHNVHLDQGHDMDPARVASAIIYLDTQPSGSGHTIFPLGGLLDWERSSDVEKAQHHRSSSVLDAGRAEWDPKLQAGRIMSRFFTPDGYGASLFQRAAVQCELGMGVRPQRGMALFFEARGKDGLETIAAAHGSCSLPPGAMTKRTLVKLATDKPIRTS